MIEKKKKGKKITGNNNKFLLGLVKIDSAWYPNSKLPFNFIYARSMINPSMFLYFPET